MCFLIRLLPLILISFSFSVFSFDNVETDIVKNENGHWTVTYNSSVEVEKLFFNSSPNNSRVNRWKPMGSFEIVIENKKEVIRQTDLKPFRKVSFELTPTYTPLPKEYAPFSPFSDGGILFHTGRFFVCSTLCKNILDKKWSVTVFAPKDDYIIANGAVFKDKATFIEQDDGQKIYVGSNTPKEEEHVISVVDKQLPIQLRNALTIEFPKLMSFYSSRFGKLNSKPMLFASYSSGRNGRYGHQGGTLPNQIFVHWYGDKLLESIDSFQASWFFSHEIAHYYQFEGGEIKALEEQWIHEGGAEYMAYRTLIEQSKASKEYAKSQLNKSTRMCIDKTKTKSFLGLVQAKDHRILYECGLIVWFAIDKELKQDGNNFDNVWCLFLNEIKSGKKADFATLLNVLKPVLKNQTFQLIKNINTAKAAEFSRLALVK